MTVTQLPMTLNAFLERLAEVVLTTAVRELTPEPASQERRKRGSLSLMLGHMEEINQQRNNHDASANAYDPGKHTYHQAEEYVEKSHGRNNRRNQLCIENRER